jgi:hypothetical protein
VNLHCLNPLRWRRPSDPGARPVTQKDLQETKKEILMKLSELAGALSTVNGKVDTIGTNVAALKAGQADPELPADAAANLAALQGNVDAVVAASNPS